MNNIQNSNSDVSAENGTKPNVKCSGGLLSSMSKWVRVEIGFPDLDIPVLCWHCYSDNYFVCYRTKDCLTGEVKWQGGAMPTHWQELTKPETIGELVKKKINAFKLTEITGIPNDVLEKFINDSYWVNSIPIIIFRKTLSTLNIDFNIAKEAIYNTLHVYPLSSTPKHLAPKMWECKEAVDKYINRLEQLMKKNCPEFPFFGAKYPDARCVDGYLYDMDNCNDEGQVYLTGEEHPCPFCNTEKFTEEQKDNEQDLEKVSKWMESVMERYG